MKEVPRIELADPLCARMHAAKPLRFEWGVVDKKGRVANALVYISAGLEGYAFEPPKAPVELDQKGCRYIPHVFGIMAGQTLKVKNSDPTTHNIHSFSEQNPAFNFSQPRQGQVTKKTFEEAEAPFLITCEIHPWMSAYGAVFTHPFFTVTGNDGRYELKGLLPGAYSVTVWHEKWAADGVSRTVKLGDGESRRRDFLLEAKR